MEVKTVGIACDHAGFPLKQFVLEYLEKKGYPVKDYGTYSDASVDYPDFGHALAEGIESGEVYPGIGICGSGEGIAMTLKSIKVCVPVWHGARRLLILFVSIMMPMFWFFLAVSLTTRPLRLFSTSSSAPHSKVVVMSAALRKSLFSTNPSLN